jgi:hypothetical protein
MDVFVFARSPVNLVHLWLLMILLVNESRIEREM